jgi:histidinol-phosphate phosphatase family protein
LGLRIPAVFLDRDGVINENRKDYIQSWEQFVFLPGSLEALHRLAGLGWPVVVISNQSAVGRRLMLAETVADIHRKMTLAVRQAGGRIDGIYVCPHTPEDNCECRKPRPGLLCQAEKELDLDLDCSYLIGDAESDVLAAMAVGVMPVLVLSGRGAGQVRRIQALNSKLNIATDLGEAVEWILSREQS